MKKILIPSIFIIVAILAGWFYYQYYFVFGEGVKSGYLNYAVKKGTIFKTFEGKLIQEGFGNSNRNPGIQSNQFEFSVENELLFDSLQTNSGKYFDLHYKEYKKALPWRGNTVYIVDKIMHIK